MRKLSTGQDSTLGNWRKLSAAVFGKDSEPVKFLDKKIADQGENEEVLADEGQFLHLLGQMYLGQEENRKDEAERPDCDR